MNPIRALALAASFAFASVATVRPARAADVPVQTGWEDVAERLAAEIEALRAAKGIPALSIALVDDQRVVWARGFGQADPATKRPATVDRSTASARCRSCSPTWPSCSSSRRGSSTSTPRSPVPAGLRAARTRSGKPITLRHADCAPLRPGPRAAGRQLLRPDDPPWPTTVASLNDTEPGLPAEAEDQVLERRASRRSATCSRDAEASRSPPGSRRPCSMPLGHEPRAFEPTPELTKDLAKAVMWTYDGRTFQAPTFALGMAPAGSMYSTVLDLAVPELCSSRGGKRGGRPPAREARDPGGDVDAAVRRRADAKSGFGLGFVVAELDGHRNVGHGGAVYGFATELIALPDDKLGVVVVDHEDCANAVIDAHRRRRPAAAARPEGRASRCRRSRRPSRCRPRRPAAWPGATRRASGRVDLTESGGRLFLTRSDADSDCSSSSAGATASSPTTRSAPGRSSRPTADASTLGDGRLHARAPTEPGAAARRSGGPDRRVRLGPQHALHPRAGGQAPRPDRVVLLYPLAEEAADVFSFPDWGLYHGEKLVFTPRRAGTRHARSRRRASSSSAARSTARTAGPSGSSRAARGRARRGGPGAPRRPPRRATSASPTSST